jgi:diamine N-acetyltransferase
MNRIIQIRLLTWDDYPAWNGFLEILSRYHYETKPEIWRRTSVSHQTPGDLQIRLNDSDRRLFLPTCDGQPSGYVDCKILRISESGHRSPRLSVHIHHLAVEVGYRGMGVAQKLISKVENWAREIGATHLELTVFEGNDDALRLYERGGFQTLHRTMHRPVKLE